jgi:CPA2 family monovalent cation:H+ antiporter-2
MQSAAEVLSGGAILIAGAFLAVALCSRLGVSSIIGFLLAGIALGPHGLDLIEGEATLGAIGEMGVVLLLFMLGLEFSFSKLVELRRVIFGVGLLQVAITTGLVAAGLCAFFSVALLPAVLMGGAVAMSSTALCLKTLAQEDALGRPQGRIAIAVLLFQDLAAVIFLVLHDAGTTGESIVNGIAAFLIGAIGLAILLLLARQALQPLSIWVAQQSATELSQLLALSVALSVAAGAAHLGLSPAVGAFAAGMMIGEGDARHVVEREVRPFRDLFLGVFFVGLGTQLDVSGVSDQLIAVAFWLLVLMPIKAVLVFAAARMTGHPTDVALQASAILSHGGEFSLMLLSVALASGIVSSVFGTPLLLAIGFSLLAAPFLVQFAAWSGIEGSNR